MINTSKTAAALAIAVISMLSAVDTAQAGGGDVAAGLLGGFAAGAIVGAATAPRPYYGPAPVYVEPPAYVAPAPYPPPACYWTRGEPVWNGYTWIRPRVQVCD